MDNSNSSNDHQAPELDYLIARVGDLPAMPTIAVRAMELIGDPSTSARRLQKIISRDQALTAKVLKIANSAMFGVSRDITTLSHAIVILGFSTIRSVVLAASTKSLYSSVKGVSGFSSKMLWEHALGCASVSRYISKCLSCAELEEAFIAGLLHDIGKTVLNMNFSDKYTKIVREVYNSKQEFQTVEMQKLGFDHTQVGALVTRKWNLAEALEEAIRHHHSSEMARTHPALTACVALANQVCLKLGIGPTKRPDIELTALPSAEHLKLDEDDISELLESVGELMSKDKELYTL